MTKNLVMAAVNWDKEDNFNKQPCEITHSHLNALIAAINSCGVCFQVWEKKDADGSRSGTFDFTSLMGSDKKLLLNHLPENLHGVIRSNSAFTVIKIWQVCRFIENDFLLGSCMLFWHIIYVYMTRNLYISIFVVSYFVFSVLVKISIYKFIHI